MGKVGDDPLVMQGSPSNPGTQQAPSPRAAMHVPPNESWQTGAGVGVGVGEGVWVGVGVGVGVAVGMSVGVGLGDSKRPTNSSPERAAFPDVEGSGMSAPRMRSPNDSPLAAAP